MVEHSPELVSLATGKKNIKRLNIWTENRVRGNSHMTVFFQLCYYWALCTVQISTLNSVIPEHGHGGLVTI